MGLLSTVLKIAASSSGITGLRSTYRPRIGPFSINTSTRTGVSSVSVGAGPLRYRVWDRQGNTGLSSVDLPGPISYRPSRTQPQPSPFSYHPAGTPTTQQGQVQGR